MLIEPPGVRTPPGPCGPASVGLRIAAPTVARGCVSGRMMHGIGLASSTAMLADGFGCSWSEQHVATGLKGATPMTISARPTQHEADDLDEQARREREPAPLEPLTTDRPDDGRR